MAMLGARGGSSGERVRTTDHHGMASNENLQLLPAAPSASPAVIPAVDEPSKSPELRGVGLSISPLMLKQMEDKVVEDDDSSSLTPRTIHIKQSIRKRSAARSSQDCRSVENSQKAQGCLSDGQNSSKFYLNYPWISQTKIFNILYCHLCR